MPFRDLVGHRRILSLLARSIARESLPPSLIFGGPAGVGKARAADALAQALNCLAPARHDAFDLDACGTCTSCRRIARCIHPDVERVEPGESGAIKIDQVRDAIDRAVYRPFEGRRRVVIVDQADALVAAAQNALLKTLEEPPSTSVFVLVTSRPDALLPTVRSRCSRLRFGRLSVSEVARVLARDHEYSEGEARAVAALADGSIGQALEARAEDSTAAREVVHDLLRQAASDGADPRHRLALAKELSAVRGARPDRDVLATHLRVLSSLLRDVGVLTSRADDRALAHLDLKPALEALARSFDGDRTVRAFTAVDRALVALERNASPKVVADWLLLQL